MPSPNKPTTIQAPHVTVHTSQVAVKRVSINNLSSQNSVSYRPKGIGKSGQSQEVIPNEATGSTKQLKSSYEVIHKQETNRHSQNTAQYDYRGRRITNGQNTLTHSSNPQSSDFPGVSMTMSTTPNQGAQSVPNRVKHSVIIQNLPINATITMNSLSSSSPAQSPTANSNGLGQTTFSAQKMASTVNMLPEPRVTQVVSIVRKQSRQKSETHGLRKSTGHNQTEDPPTDSQNKDKQKETVSSQKNINNTNSNINNTNNTNNINNINNKQKMNSPQNSPNNQKTSAKAIKKFNKFSNAGSSTSLPESQASSKNINSTKNNIPYSKNAKSNNKNVESKINPPNLTYLASESVQNGGQMAQHQNSYVAESSTISIEHKNEGANKEDQQYKDCLQLLNHYQYFIDQKPSNEEDSRIKKNQGISKPSSRSSAGSQPMTPKTQSLEQSPQSSAQYQQQIKNDSYDQLIRRPIETMLPQHASMPQRSFEGLAGTSEISIMQESLCHPLLGAELEGAAIAVHQSREYLSKTPNNEIIGNFSEPNNFTIPSSMSEEVQFDNSPSKRRSDLQIMTLNESFRANKTNSPRNSGNKDILDVKKLTLLTNPISSSELLTTAPLALPLIPLLLKQIEQLKEVVFHLEKENKELKRRGEV